MDTLEHLIDTTMLLRFGNGAVVPIGRATLANTASIGALDTRVTAIEEDTDPEFIDSLVAALFSGGTLSAEMTTASGDVLINENGNTIAATRSFAS